MKILAPFDQSHMSQATIPLLAQLARSNANVEVTLLSVATVARDAEFQQSIRNRVVVTSFTDVLPVRLPEIEPRIAESRRQSAERALECLHTYLLDIAGRLPSGIRINTEAYLSDTPQIAIHDCATRRRVDFILMTRRSKPRGSRLTSHFLFGSTAEAIVESAVAATVLVRSDEPAILDQVSPELSMTRRARLAHEFSQHPQPR